MSQLLITAVLGIATGWALGFLRLPHLEKNHSFLLGFLAALALVSLGLLLLMAWNKDLLFGLMGSKRGSGDAKSTRRQTLVWIILLALLVLGGLVGGIAVYRQHASCQLKIQSQDKKLREMAAQVEAAKKNDSGPLIRSILDDVEQEIKSMPGRRLRDTTIARIAALSFAFKPYKYFEGDSLQEQACSPERGQLLQALVLMQIDTGSFAGIIRSTTFAGADLRGADLKGLDLSGINLKGAILKDADLSGANLKGADLTGANLWGARLNQSNLSNTVLIKADFSWAQLNEAILTMANLNGANFTNAQLRKADLNEATFIWAQSVGAMFNEAILTKVVFEGTNFAKANLSQANLGGSDLRRIDLSEAVLTGASLDKAMVDKNWLETLKGWQLIGEQELLDKYYVINDASLLLDRRPLYHLRKKR